VGTLNRIELPAASLSVLESWSAKLASRANTFVPGSDAQPSKKFSIDPKKNRIPRRSNSPLSFCDTFSLRTSHYLTETNPPLKADN